MPVRAMRASAAAGSRVTRRGARRRNRYSGATAATTGLQTHDASRVAAAFLRIASRKRGVAAAIQATQSAAANSPALAIRLASGGCVGPDNYAGQTVVREPGAARCRRLGGGCRRRTSPPAGTRSNAAAAAGLRFSYPVGIVGGNRVLVLALRRVDVAHHQLDGDAGTRGGT